MRRTRLLLLALPLVGCGGTMPPPDPDPPAHGYQVATGEYTVPPASEKYFCFAHTLTEAEAVAVTKLDVFASPSVHHLVLFKTLTKEQDGFSECPVLIKQTWVPMYGGGRSTSGLTLPAGTGFQLAPNDQILMQLHLLNATTREASEKTFVNLTYAPDPSVVTPAGIFALGSMAIDIPAAAKGFQVTSACNLSHAPLHVFAAFPHMHQLGTRITLERGTGTGADAQLIYQRNPWLFGDQPMDPLTLEIGSGDYLRATCTYDNGTGKDVLYGESSYNEMCYMVLFYTPFDHLDGCIQ